MFAHIRAFKIIFISIILILFSFQYVNAKDWINKQSEEWIHKKAVLPPQDYFTTRKDDHYLFLVENRHMRPVLDQIMAGEYEYALGNLYFVLRAFPNHPKALYFLGRIAIMEKVPWLPLPWYRKVLKLFPQHAYTHAQYGNYMAENNEDDIDMIKDGIVKLKRAIEINPKLARAHTWLAKAYYKDGNLELALQAAKKAKELGSQDKMLDEIQKNNLQKKEK